MTYSLNEIEAMAKRAARGAGLDWGIAEEAGKAARWLAARGLPGPKMLADLLTRNDSMRYDDLAPVATDGVWRAPAGPLSPLIAGVALSDRAAQIAARGVEMGQVALPLLLAPYAAQASKASGTAMTLSWPGAAVTVFPDGGMSAEGAPQALAAPAAEGLSCRPAGQAARPAPVAPPAQMVAPADWSRLEAFAQRTYAPATEASRVLGAGAGLSDND